ncbi:pyridoxamine 5'-phosphate oxidase [Jatrophihabitans sp.]|uniref:pyridoxamine 5'-phosphate oxidase n=1 Tax=Jatrophihabitans sp. TaxID=1932789 RepID=UPI0030C728E3|nr:pdxH [Jatrophihabitans sp.]
MTPTAPDPAELRRSYERASLGESSLASSWSEQLLAWFDAAYRDLGAVEANAIQLATVDEFGHPAVRTVLAKGIDERGVSFFTNYDSAKGRDLDARPYAAIVFLWPAHERQVRLSGPVSRVSAEETAAYFATRPRGSQLGAWASPQSQVVASRASLEALQAAAEERFGDGEIPPPPNWGGYRLAPEAVEFWQGRPNRLHDRLRFRLDAGEWVVERLAP